jgi:hypothetical protein
LPLSLSLLGDVFAYEVLGSPDSVLASWDRNRNDSVGGGTSAVDEEAAVDNDETVMSSAGEGNEVTNASAGEANDVTRTGASQRTGPTAASERRASPPWNFDKVEQSLVLDENGNKRSTRANRPQPGSLKE